MLEEEQKVGKTLLWGKLKRGGHRNKSSLRNRNKKYEKEHLKL
ncbi:unnamed protein product [marine sediment metagenome]|uniref:Uncharacterized protein n=1 Tax=marine sediment metagenome TaxID=412755 RepID=X1FX05_9ZZZZ